MTWRGAAVLLGRLLFAAMFALAFIFKFAGIGATAGYIAAAGFPFATLLAWLAVVFELALFLCLLTGALFSEAALLAALYVVFLGFAFHGPSHWAADQHEFGAFMSHFPFAAGLLFAAAHGPGRLLSLPFSLLRRN
jgi:putative oxidoreductase